MRIEIWSDVVCPWCYIGKRRLERADFDEARMLGANGVPFFVIDRTYGVSGAQSAETFLHALRTAYAAEDAAAR